MLEHLARAAGGGRRGPGAARLGAAAAGRGGAASWCWRSGTRGARDYPAERPASTSRFAEARRAHARPPSPWSARASALTYAGAGRAGPTSWPTTCGRWASGPEVRVGLHGALAGDGGGASWASSRPAAPTCRSTPPTRPSAWPSCCGTPGVAVLLTQAALRGTLPETAVRSRRPRRRPWTLPPRAHRTRERRRAGEPGVRHLHLGLAPAAPKGVVVDARQRRPPVRGHRGVVRLRRAEDVWTLFHSYAFDFSVLGDLGRAALRRQAGGRARTRRAATRRPSAGCWRRSG